MDAPDAPAISKVYAAPSTVDAICGAAADAFELGERGYIVTSFRWSPPVMHKRRGRGCVVLGVLAVTATVVPVWWALDWMGQHPGNDASLFLLVIYLIPAAFLGVASLLVGMLDDGVVHTVVPGRLEVTWAKTAEVPNSEHAPPA